MSKTELEKMIDTGTELAIGSLVMGFLVALLLFWWIASWPIIKAIDEKLDPRIFYIERDYRTLMDKIDDPHKHIDEQMEKGEKRREHWERNRYRGD